MSRFLAFSLLAILAACGSKFDGKPPGAEKSGKLPAVLTRDEAMKLASLGNCVSCHKMDDRLAGPGWREVGVRYGSDSKAAPLISSHIREGGTFGWNMGYMPARGGGALTDSQIDALAQYIATLH
ncbi:MAG: cytochrome c [Burkholderiales bacterium]|nr:cytochrome c [Burkholderiales bacterium]